MNQSSGKRDETRSRPITFQAAEDLGPFELAKLWVDTTVWPVDKRSQYDELAELAVMSALATWLRRWQPIAIHGAILAGARPEAVAGALGNSLQIAFDRWHDAGLAAAVVQAARRSARGVHGNRAARAGNARGQRLRAARRVQAPPGHLAGVAPMFFAYVLVTWACLGAVSAAIHMLFVFRSLSGREGAESRAVSVEHAARAGGTRRWIMISIASDMLMPWVTVQGLMITCRRAGV